MWGPRVTVGADRLRITCQQETQSVTQSTILITPSQWPYFARHSLQAPLESSNTPLCATKPAWHSASAPVRSVLLPEAHAIQTACECEVWRQTLCFLAPVVPRLLAETCLLCFLSFHCLCFCPSSTQRYFRLHWYRKIYCFSSRSTSNTSL